MKNKTQWIAAIGLSAGLLLAGCAPQDDSVMKIGEYEMTDNELYSLLVKEPMGNGYTYGERIVEQHMVQQLLEMEYGDRVSDAMIQESLDEMISMYGGEEGYEEFLSSEGFTHEYMESNARNSLLYDIALHESFPVDEDELREMFDRQIPVGTRVAHILVEEEKTAHTLIDALEEGADFAELVHEYSLDEASIANDGQYTIVQGDFDPAFEEASLNLKRDEFTREPVQTAHGYHIIQSVSEGVERSFEQSRDALESSWYRQLFEMNEFIYEIIIYDLVEKYESDIVISSDQMGGIVDRILNEKPSNEPIMDTPEPEDEIEILFESNDEEELKEFLENEFSDFDDEDA